MHVLWLASGVCSNTEGSRRDATSATGPSRSTFCAPRLVYRYLRVVCPLRRPIDGPDLGTYPNPSACAYKSSILTCQAWLLSIVRV